MSEALDLTGLTNIDDVLARTPNGPAMRKLLRNLGVWLQDAPSESRSRNRAVGNMSPDQVLNEFGYWQSEASRFLEVIGVLEGEEEELKLRYERIRSQQAAMVLREWAEDTDGKKNLTQKQTFALVDDKPEVQEAQDRLLLVRKLLKTLERVHEAHADYCAMLSRKISMEQALANQRLSR